MKSLNTPDVVHRMQVASAIGSFLKRMGDAALPSVEKLMQEYLNPLLLDPARRPEERWVPLLVVSDCIEHAPASAKHLPALLPQLATNAQSERPELVQVCVYTLGVVAEKHPSVRLQPDCSARQRVMHATRVCVCVFLHRLSCTVAKGVCGATSA